MNPLAEKPVPVGERLEVVDALRGFALFGLLMVHMVERFELYWIEPRPDVWFDTVFAIFAGKSFAIFALLFGFGFATIMSNYRRRGVSFARRFAWRLLLLFTLGTLHALLYRGDILQVLALMGLVLIPFDKVTRPGVLIIIAAMLFLQMPLLLQSWAAAQGFAFAQQPPLFFSDTGLAQIADGNLGTLIATNAGPGFSGKWSFYWSTGRLSQIAGLFVVGMQLQRLGAFARPETFRAGWIAALVGSGVLWSALVMAGGMLIPPGPDDGGAPMQAQAFIWALDSWRALALTALQVALFVLLWQWKARSLLRWFALSGRMTLTLYVFQSAVMVPMFYGFGLGLWRDLTTAQSVLIGLTFFALQTAFAAWWYRRFLYGPLEWAWRAGTLTTWSIPMRRRNAG